MGKNRSPSDMPTVQDTEVVMDDSSAPEEVLTGPVVPVGLTSPASQPAAAGAQPATFRPHVAQPITRRPVIPVLIRKCPAAFEALNADLKTALSEERYAVMARIVTAQAKCDARLTISHMNEMAVSKDELIELPYWFAAQHGKTFFLKG